ncbi:MAG: winged helix-turn-helix domain-containing protein [Candidatus Hermodarchaeota archaeon]
MQKPRVRLLRSASSSQLVLQSIPAQILLLLSKYGERTAYALAKDLKLPRQNVLYYLKKLREENLVYQTRTERKKLQNKDLEKQFERKYYDVAWEVLMPTLKNLRQESSIILEHDLRSFIYGWLLGKNFSGDQIYRLLDFSPGKNKKIKKIEEEIAEELENLFLEYEKEGDNPQSSIRQRTKSLEDDFSSLNNQKVDGETLRYFFLALATKKVVNKRLENIKE